MTQKTAELKAKFLAKTCIKNRLNQSAVARELGVSHQAIQQQIHKPIVRDKLQAFLDSPELDQLLLEVAKDGLVATRTTGAAILLTQKGETIKAEEQGAIETPDHSARHRFWHDCMIMKKKLKMDSSAGEGERHIINNVLVRIGEIEKSQVKSDVTTS